MTKKFNKKKLNATPALSTACREPVESTEGARRRKERPETNLR
jgi:hypothetical protein